MAPPAFSAQTQVTLKLPPRRRRRMSAPQTRAQPPRSTVVLLLPLPTSAKPLPVCLPTWHPPQRQKIATVPQPLRPRSPKRSWDCHLFPLLRAPSTRRMTMASLRRRWGGIWCESRWPPLNCSLNSKIRRLECPAKSWSRPWPISWRRLIRWSSIFWAKCISASKSLSKGF